MNLQVIASPGGDVRWVSGTLPGSVHDKKAGVDPPTADPRGRSRMDSRDMAAFTGKIVLAMRSEFGGHAEKRA